MNRSIADLFSEWTVVHHTAWNEQLAMGDFVAQWDREDALERQLAEMKPTTMAELAAIVLAVTHFGDEAMTNYGCGDQVVTLLRELVGVRA